MWVFVGLLLGSLVVSQHDTEEACKGRKAMMADRKDAPVYGQCVAMPTGAGGLMVSDGKGGWKWTSPTGLIENYR